MLNTVHVTAAAFCLEPLFRTQCIGIKAAAILWLLARDIASLNYSVQSDVENVFHFYLVYSLKHCCTYKLHI